MLKAHRSPVSENKERSLLKLVSPIVGGNRSAFELLADGIECAATPVSRID